jgi:hypothetical protein
LGSTRWYLPSMRASSLRTDTPSGVTSSHARPRISPCRSPVPRARTNRNSSRSPRHTASSRSASSCVSDRGSSTTTFGASTNSRPATLRGMMPWRTAVTSALRRTAWECCKRRVPTRSPATRSHVSTWAAVRSTTRMEPRAGAMWVTIAARYEARVAGRMLRASQPTDRGSRQPSSATAATPPESRSSLSFSCASRLGSRGPGHVPAFVSWADADLRDPRAVARPLEDAALARHPALRHLSIVRPGPPSHRGGTMCGRRDSPPGRLAGSRGAAHAAAP